MPEWTATYDERGNQTSASYFGDRRQALPAQGRVRRSKADLRRAGKPDERVLLRHRRQALPVQGRVCRSATLTYDERGNQTSASYFGTDGKPCLHKDGICRMEGHLRRAGKRDERVLLRHRRQALPEQGRVCRSEVDLRRAGKPDEPVLLRHRRQALPAQGRQCRMEGHLRRAGKRDKPVLLRHRRQALPVEGRVCRMRGPPTTSGETRRARPSSAPTASPACTRTAMPNGRPTYDERGNKTSESYFGIDGKPACIKTALPK